MGQISVTALDNCVLFLHYASDFLKNSTLMKLFASVRERDVISYNFEIKLTTFPRRMMKTADVSFSCIFRPCSQT